MEHITRFYRVHRQKHAFLVINERAPILRRFVTRGKWLLMDPKWEVWLSKFSHARISDEETKYQTERRAWRHKHAKDLDKNMTESVDSRTMSSVSKVDSFISKLRKLMVLWKFSARIARPFFPNFWSRNEVTRFTKNWLRKFRYFAGLRRKKIRFWRMVW